MIICHLTTYRASRNRFSAFSFHDGSCILWGASTDTSVTRPILDRVQVDISVEYRSSIGRVSVEYQSSIGRCIDRYSYRSIYLAVHRYLTNTSPTRYRYFTDTSPIFHRCFTDTLHRSILDRHATDR